MKKIIISLVAVISAILMCFGMAACTPDLEGKVYVFDTVKVSTDAEMLEMVEAVYKDKQISFNVENGTCSYLGKTKYYVQDGSTIYLYDTADDSAKADKDEATLKFKISGKRITIEEEFLGVNMTMSFKLKKADDKETEK